MKKILALALASAMAVSLVACGGSSSSSSAAASTPASGSTAASGAATTTDFPTDQITIICPYSAGGASDTTSRIFASELEKAIGTSVVVENKTGASGAVGLEAVRSANPDGYTMGMITFELAAYKAQDMSDYTYERFDPLCRVNTDAAAITVNTEWAAANGITDVTTFVEYCKAHPGEVLMGGSSSGSVWHIAGGYLMNATGIDIKMITYANGAADAVKAAAQGEIQGVTVSLAEARAFIGNGLTVLGVMDTERNSAFPDAPTCQEQGFDVVYATQRGMALPLGVDDAIRAKLQAACAAAIDDPDFVEFMKNNGQTISYMTAEEYGAYLAQAAQDVPKAMEAVGLL